MTKLYEVAFPNRPLVQVHAANASTAIKEAKKYFLEDYNVAVTGKPTYCTPVKDTTQDFVSNETILKNHQKRL